MSGPVCGVGMTDVSFAPHFPNHRCDREAGHGGAHRMRRAGREDWWLGHTVGISELLVLEGEAEDAREAVKRARAAERAAAKAERDAAREAKHKAKASGELFAKEPKP